jgi:hypothetical protein
MLVNLKRLTAKIVAAFAIIFACAASLSSVDAEAAGKTYTVTFRAGNVGRIDAGKIASGSTTEVTKNYIRFTVERGESLKSAGFFADNDTLNSTLRYAVTVDDNYMLLDLADVCDAAITRNTEYVLDYARLVDSVLYTVYYMDSFSGEQIASPTIAYGNDGDVISGISPLAIAGYFTSDAATSVTLDKNAENTVIFYYSTNNAQTITNTVTVNVPGETVVVDEAGQTITVTTGTANAPTANAAVNNAEANEAANDAADDADNANEAEIADEDVPLGASDNEDASSDDTVSIADEEVPLGAMFTSNGMVQAGIIFIGFVLVVAGVALRSLKEKR